MLHFIRLIICLSLALLAGLGAAHAGRPVPSEAAPPVSLTIGTTEEVPSLDPADAGDFFAWEILSHLYTGLTRQEPGTLDYALALADSHSASEDGLTHTFTIRPDAAFSDGTRITARTFAASIQRALRLNGRGGAVIAPYVESAAAQDDRTLALKLTAPFPFVEQLVALPPFFPVHPDIFPAARLNQTPEAFIGNGIYRLRDSAPGRLTLGADPAWRGAPPGAETIIIQQFRLPADLREALWAGQVDIAWRGLPPDDIDKLAGAASLVRAPGLQVFYLLINRAQPPFDDPVVRRGLLHLLDRERAAQAGLGGTAIPLYTLLPPEVARGAAYPALDAEQADAVLTGGGYSRFRRVEGEVQTSRLLYGDRYGSATDLLIGPLARHEAFRIGRFDVEPDTFLDQIRRGTFRLSVIGWAPLVPHPDAYLRPLLAGELAEAMHYRDEQVRVLLDHAARAPAEAALLYAEVQAIAAGDVVAVPLWQGLQSLLYRETVDPASIVIAPNFLLRYDQLRHARESRP